MHEGTESATPRVFVTSRPPRHHLDYVDQLVGDDSSGHAPADVMREFGTDPFRARDVDVVHLTDIARAIGSHRVSEHERTRRAKRFVTLLRRRRIALVRTVRAEELERAPSRAEAIIDRAAVARVVLSATRSSHGSEFVVIAHSHLRDRFLGFPRGEAQPGRILMTPHIRFPGPDEAALKVFSAAELPTWTLRIAGDVPEDLRSSYARTLADHTETITLRDETLSDAVSVEEVGQSEIVLVTAPETYESQSTILLALSLERPVMVEDSRAMQLLADEVGAAWVRRYPGALTVESLETTLRAFRAAPPTDRPNLDAREPNAIASQYAAIFRAAAARR